MRLGTCITLEIAIAAGALWGVAIGVGHMADLAGDYVVPPVEASAHPSPTPLERSTLQVTYTEPKTIFGAPDSELLAPLGEGTVTKIKLNRGGTSLSLRLDFSNGTRAAFKPEQTFPQSDPRREIAAYRIDRLLGINHVAPARATAIPYQQLVDAAEPGHRAYVAERLQDAIVRDGIVYGELQWWIPEIKLAAFGRQRIDEREGKDLWHAYLSAGATIPPEHRRLCEQLSTLIVFDVLIDNADRWSGSNTMMSPDGSTLFFMDNTLSFSIHKFGHEIPNTALRRIEVFSKRLVERLRSLTYEQIERVLDMGNDTRLGALLTPEQMRAIIARRDNILVHVDRLIAKHGEEAVLALP
ncbi:MAG TPA: hypothetical protein VK427_06115 [Kofleriaceae bacterium]|nr:hypothetical protein [Kofleriaceae bacterium]